MVLRLATCAAFLLGALTMALPARAQPPQARVTTYLNMRAGPDPNYPVVTVIPEGHVVDVLQCVPDYRWCDVGWRGRRGWVYAGYLQDARPEYYGRALPQIGVRLGIPLFDFFRHHPRPHHHGYWREHRRHERIEQRRERRWERRHERHERRAIRREHRREERHIRHERRRDRHHERREHHGHDRGHDGGRDHGRDRHT